MKASLIISLCLSTAFAMSGVDYSTPQTLNTHNCFKTNGIEFTIARAF